MRFKCCLCLLPKSSLLWARVGCFDSIFFLFSPQTHSLTPSLTWWLSERKLWLDRICSSAGTRSGRHRGWSHSWQTNCRRHLFDISQSIGHWDRWGVHRDAKQSGNKVERWSCQSGGKVARTQLTCSSSSGCSAWQGSSMVVPVMATKLLGSMASRGGNCECSTLIVASTLTSPFSLLAVQR